MRLIKTVIIGVFTKPYAATTSEIALSVYGQYTSILFDLIKFDDDDDNNKNNNNNVYEQFLFCFILYRKKLFKTDWASQFE